MLGTIEKVRSGIEVKYQKSCEVSMLLRHLGLQYRKYNLDVSYKTKYQISDRKALKRCVELSKQFKIVEIDETVKRKLRTKTGEVIQCELVFSCNLPLKTVVTKQVQGNDGKDYVLKTQTPLPTSEVLRSIKSYKNLFDNIAIWWVPNDILIEEVKELDPILVGKVETKFHGNICFELCRWVDENFEAEYWTKEGY
jgi:hypothetical protein